MFAFAIFLAAVHAESDADSFEANWRMYKVDMTAGLLVTDFLIEMSTEYSEQRWLQILTRRRKAPQ